MAWSRALRSDRTLFHTNMPILDIPPSNPDGTYDAKLVDDKGKLYLILHGYQTMDLPDPVPVDLLGPLQQAFKV